MHVLIEKMYAAVTHFYKALARYYFVHKSNLFLRQNSDINSIHAPLKQVLCQLFILCVKRFSFIRFVFFT